MVSKCSSFICVAGRFCLASASSCITRVGEVSHEKTVYSFAKKTSSFISNKARHEFTILVLYLIFIVFNS